MPRYETQLPKMKKATTNKIHNNTTIIKKVIKQLQPFPYLRDIKHHL